MNRTVTIDNVTLLVEHIIAWRVSQFDGGTFTDVWLRYAPAAAFGIKGDHSAALAKAVEANRAG